MEIYVKKISFISIFSPFSEFQTWFYQMRGLYPYRSFKHSKWWRHKLGHTYRIFNTDLLYSVDHFIVEIDEKCSFNDGFINFYYDLMMILDSGLLFGPPCNGPV